MAEVSLEIIISSGLVSAITTLLITVLALGTYKQKVDTSEKCLEKHDDKITAISDRVSKLEGGVDRDRVHHSEYIQRKSPLGLTEKGKALLLDSKGKDYVDGNKGALIAAIKASNPKTAYDVQELAKTVIEARTDDDSFSPIKEFAFKQGLKLDVLTEIFGIYLRDIAIPELGFRAADIKD